MYGRAASLATVRCPICEQQLLYRAGRSRSFGLRKTKALHLFLVCNDVILSGVGSTLMSCAADLEASQRPCSYYNKQEQWNSEIVIKQHGIVVRPLLKASRRIAVYHPRGLLSLNLQEQLSLWPETSLWWPNDLLYASLPPLPNLVHSAWYVVTISPIFPLKITPALPLSYPAPLFSCIVSICI